MSIKVWLDCDPGHDDMLAIIMAALSPEIQIIGLCTSAGNSTIDMTTQNTLNILEELNITNLMVVKGASKPLCCQLQTASQIHGQNGLEGVALKFSHVLPIVQQPYLKIYQKIMSQKQPINYVVTGSMTNLAILLRAFPQISKQIKQVVFMGGAIGLGNWNPAAEFNIFVDPEAADIVLSSNLPVVMVPLEVTHQVLITEDIFEQLANMKSQFGAKLIPLLRFFQKLYKKNQNFDFPAAHDPCTIYYLLQPSEFKVRQALVSVELEGNSRGRTNCKFITNQPNATVCENVNTKGFWNVMLKCIRMIK